MINLLICTPKLDTGLAFFVYQNILRGGNLAYFLPKIPSYSYLRGQNTLLFSLVTINFWCCHFSTGEHPLIFKKSLSLLYILNHVCLLSIFKTLQVIALSVLFIVVKNYPKLSLKQQTYDLTQEWEGFWGPGIWGQFGRVFWLRVSHGVAVTLGAGASAIWSLAEKLGLLRTWLLPEQVIQEWGREQERMTHTRATVFYSPNPEVTYRHYCHMGHRLTLCDVGGGWTGCKCQVRVTGAFVGAGGCKQQLPRESGWSLRKV